MNFKDKEARKAIESLANRLGYTLEYGELGNVYCWAKGKTVSPLGVEIIREISTETEKRVNKLYRHLGLEICEGGEIKKVSKKK